ncbi:MAG: TonB-dependent receptor, partial [Sphingobacteriales bacterium]
MNFFSTQDINCLGKLVKKKSHALLLCTVAVFYTSLAEAGTNRLATNTITVLNIQQTQQPSPQEQTAPQQPAQQQPVVEPAQTAPPQTQPATAPEPAAQPATPAQQPATPAATATPAGDISVTGKVVDETGLPLPGATVSVNNTTKAIATDANGSFTLTVAAETDKLHVSFIGYETQVIVVGKNRAFNVQLQVSRSNQLKEVVVVGYGTNTRANLTTSIGSVKGDAINERPTTLSAVQGLAGKVSGVNIMSNSGRPGGNPTVKIRGTSSLTTAASQNPLYVIDGFVGADPSTIDPSVIEDVQVYKDASASAIYGSRAANGVIVITTKRGKSNQADISFNNTVSFGSLARKIDLLDGPGALEMVKRQWESVPGRLAPHLDPANNFPRKDELFNADGTAKYNTDWQDETTRLAVSHNHSLTFSGGTDSLKVLANVAYRNNQGILINSYQKQLLANINLDWNVKKWLKIQTNINAGGTQGNNVEINTFGLNAVRMMYDFLPFLPVKYADGTYSRKGDYPQAENSENPVKLLNDVKDVSGRTAARGYFKGIFRISSDLDFTTTFGGEIGSTYRNYYSGIDVFDFSLNQRGVAQRSTATFGSWTNENYFNYHKKFGKHNIQALLGASWYNYVTSNLSAGAENFLDDTFQDFNLGAGNVIQTPGSGRDQNRFQSLFSRINYNYNDTYLIEASLRADGNSRFIDENKYGYFPSVSAAWRFSNEEFFSSLKNVFSNAKLRGSFGVVGNADVTNYITKTRYNSGQYIFNKVRQPSIVLGSLGNPDLLWERVEQFDIGLDFSLLGGRVDVVMDYYNKVSKSLLYNKQIPATSGFATVFDNIGSVRNRGFELGINSVNINTDKVKWNTSFNFTLNRSKVLELEDELFNVGSHIKQGGPINEFYGYIRQGTWSTAEADAAAKYGAAPGDIKYRDINGDGQINGQFDRVDLGNAMPSFEANMTNTVSYKGFTFFLDLQGMYGNHLYNLPRALAETGAQRVNSFEAALNAWTPTNQNTVVPRLRLSGDQTGLSDVDSYYVEDGSFLRVRNVALSYKFN